MMSSNGEARPLVLLCECAGTMQNIDFDALEASAAESADVVRGAHWCSREGQAQLLEYMEAGRAAGRSSSPAARPTSPRAASRSSTRAASGSRSPTSARAAAGCTATATA